MTNRHAVVGPTHLQDRLLPRHVPPYRKGTHMTVQPPTHLSGHMTETVGLSDK